MTLSSGILGQRTTPTMVERPLCSQVLNRIPQEFFSELNIVMCLQRVFESNHIYLNPVRTDNGKEFVDVLVATSSNILLIQAKNSPNTEDILYRSIERKILTVARHLRKATKQMRGSISYATTSNSICINCGSVRHTFNIDNLDITALIIVQELFSTEYGYYSQLAFNIFKKNRRSLLYSRLPRISRFHFSP